MLPPLFQDLLSPLRIKLIPKFTFISFKEECYFNCTLVFNEWGRRVVKDLSCMENCFEERSCVSSLLKDIILKGVCMCAKDFTRRTCFTTGDLL